MSVSVITIEPRSGLSSPTSDLRKTDLPVPEGPSSTEISPGGRVKVTSLQMFWLPNALVSPSTGPRRPLSTSPVSRLRRRPHTAPDPDYSWVTRTPGGGYVRSADDVTRLAVTSLESDRGRPPGGGRPLWRAGWCRSPAQAGEGVT